MRGTKDKEESGPDPTLRKDFDYQRIYLEGYLLLFKEASGQGLLAEYEDLIDTLYAFFPSKHKSKMAVLDSTMSKWNPVGEEWAKALKMGPPPGDPIIEKERAKRIEVRSRCLRKAQIVSDIAEKLKLLGEEFDVSEMGEDSDVLTTLKQSAESVTEG
jgi:hypothetical protein